MSARNSLVTAILALCLLILWSNPCLAGLATISGTVVDAETNEPVEGAIVVFEWGQTKGVPGMTYTDHYKTVETVTDFDGRFSVTRVLNPLVNEPDFVIYKKGYYCWRQEWDPLTDSRRDDFKLRSGLTYEMDRYVPGKYLHMYSKAPCYTGITENTPLLDEAILWEHKLVTKEQRLYQEKFDNLPPEEKAKCHVPPELLINDHQKYRETKNIADEIQRQLWNEVLQELYMSPEEKNHE